MTKIFFEGLGQALSASPDSLTPVDAIALLRASMTSAGVLLGFM